MRASPSFLPVLVVAAALLPGHGVAAPGAAGTFPRPVAGTWARTVTAADVSRAGGTAAFVVSPGRWRLQVAATGAYALFNTASGPPAVRSRFAVATPGTLAVRFPGDDLVECRARGTYTWRATAKQLTLRRVKDGCGGRVAVLVGTWRRVG